MNILYRGHRGYFVFCTMSSFKLYFSILIIGLTLKPVYLKDNITVFNTRFFRVWGPGLVPHKIILPARYFFIQDVDSKNESIPILEDKTLVKISGLSSSNKQCRIWTNILNRNDGSLIVRYKVYESCKQLTIDIRYKNEPVAESPYIINDTVYPDECSCPTNDLESTLNYWECGRVPFQINQDLNEFRNIDWNMLRTDIINEFNKPHAVSLCHYVINNNRIHRKCYGKYVGFNMFMDNILFSLTRKVMLPNLEFFVNLGDWPLASKTLPTRFPIFSWCGNKHSYDIVMPTYDLTESTLENMGRVMLDMLSVQGNALIAWPERLSQLFWRGRDANKHRLDLISISREYPDLFNVSITNFFFFKNVEHIYGPKSEYVSFFKFFDYKYQLAADGTVAPYRMPYLLGGGSLVFKQESEYYEHFYQDLQPNKHYVPVKKDFSDLVEKIKWAQSNDEEAFRIAKSSLDFANENLLPKNIFCYHMHLFNEFSKKIVSDIKVFDDMEYLKDAKAKKCICNEQIKDELNNMFVLLQTIIDCLE